MGKVSIVAELSEDGLVQSEGVTHPGGGQVKDCPDGLFQHLIPVFAGPIGVHIGRHGFSLANGIGQSDGTAIRQTGRYNVLSNIYSLGLGAYSLIFGAEELVA